MATTLQIKNADKKYQKLHSLDLRVDIQISSAFVTVTSEWMVGADGWYTLEIPMNPNTTITHIEVTTDNILIQSAIIPEEEFKAYFRGTQNVEYNHDVFNFPFELKGGPHRAEKVIRVFVTYFESMTFDAAERKYSFTFPMILNDQIVSRTHRPDVRVYATINTAAAFQWGSTTHPLQVVNRSSPTNIETCCRDFYPSTNSNFEVFYSIATTDILCSLLVNEANLDPYDPRQTFCVNIHPPPETALNMGAFGRKIVFLIDVSGSMHGEPLQQAIQSLQSGLQMMKPTDYFNICAFNHTTSFFQPTLQQASPQWIGSAIAWTMSLIASGGTDIMTPTQLAANALQSFQSPHGEIPMIFLITDGAVDNETEIFHWVAANCANIRVHTLGIGKFCNAYFLKMVALAGRGLNDQIMSNKFLSTQFLNMLKSANTPILTNVEVLLPVQNSQYEIFPNPVPDLFCGNPLVISGKSGQYFDHVLIRGLLPNNVPFTTKAYPLMVPIYLHGIFVKQRLDYLVGQAWLTKDLNTKKQAIDLSCRAHIPSPYTTMVAYSVEPSKRPNRQLTTAEIAAISVGGVIAIVGLGMTLGSVLDTGLATTVFQHMGGGGHTFFGGGGGGGGHGGSTDCNCCGSGSGNGCCGNGSCNGCCDCGHGGGCCDCCGGGGGGCDCCQCNGCNCDCHCGDCGNCDCNGCTNCDCGGCDCGGCDCGGCDCNC